MWSGETRESPASTSSYTAHATKRGTTAARPGFSRRQRIAVALVVGVAAGLVSFNQITDTNHLRGVWRWGQDFTYPWRAGQALRVGVNPYEAIQPVPGSTYPFAHVLAYPLPAVVVAAPFANIHADVAAAIFGGLGFALAAYGLLGLATWRLLVLVSASAAWSIANGQWAPLLIGATLVPWFGFLLACKPTLGAALFVYRPDRRILIGGLLFVALCFLIQPSWLRDWLTTSRHNVDVPLYLPPILWRGGWLLALALLRWRRPEARLLFALACIPQNVYFADQLALLLIPDGLVEMAGYVVWTHLVQFAAAKAHPTISADLVTPFWRPYILWGLYLPALLLVLRRANEGAVPGERSPIGRAHVADGVPSPRGQR